MKQRNTLGDAYLAAYAATNLAADITLVLDIASERPQPGIDADQQAKLHDMFRRMHEDMYKAEEEFTAQLADQPAQPPVHSAQSTVQRAGHAGSARRARGTRR